jgi:predicted DNA binding CopG/RHH family protein
MKKNAEIRIKISSEELEQIKRKAASLEMTISGFCRYLALTSNLKLTKVE